MQLASDSGERKIRHKPHPWISKGAALGSDRVSGRAARVATGCDSVGKDLEPKIFLVLEKRLLRLTEEALRLHFSVSTISCVGEFGSGLLGGLERIKRQRQP